MHADSSVASLRAQGFRKYESIRLTLCHELTHNVWGDHDNNFKELCSQITREVEEVRCCGAGAGAWPGHRGGGCESAVRAVSQYTRGVEEVCRAGACGVRVEKGAWGIRDEGPASCYLRCSRSPARSTAQQESFTRPHADTTAFAPHALHCSPSNSQVHAQQRGAGHLALQDDPLAQLHSRRLGGDVSLPDDAMDGSSSSAHPAMAATASSSGKTLRQLAKEQRQQQQQLQQQQRQGAGVVGGGAGMGWSVPGGGGGMVATVHGGGGSAGLVARERAAVAVAGNVGAERRPAEGEGSGGGGASPGSESGEEAEGDVARVWERSDPRTEELERRQRALEQ